jgi:microcystin-dependent protein
MAIRKKSFFFSPSSDDGFNTGDRPSESTFRDLLDSVIMIKELSSRAQQTKAGIVKLATDDDVNQQTITDSAGISPAGFPLVINPAQLPRIIPGTGINLTAVPRNAGDPTQTLDGSRINDILVDVTTVVPSEATEITLSGNVNVDRVSDISCGSITVDTDNLTEATDLQTALETIINAINETAVNLAVLAQAICDQDNVLQVGDIILSSVPPGSWTDKYLLPIGQTVPRVAYPDLFTLFGTTYNTGGESGDEFRLPDLRDKFIYTDDSSGSPTPLVPGGTDDFAIAIANLPSHTHSFDVTGNTTNSGTHVHAMTGTDKVTPVATDAGDGSGAILATGDGGGGLESSGFTGPDNFTGSTLDGAHQHGINLVGLNTDPVGSGDPIAYKPRYIVYYPKLRAK